MERHKKILTFAKMDLKGITDEMDDQDTEDNEVLMERVGELIKRNKTSTNRTKDAMLEEDSPLEEIAVMLRTQKERLISGRQKKS